MAKFVTLLALIVLLSCISLACSSSALVQKTQKVKIAAIGPWKLDPTANFMGQYTFLSFACSVINNQSNFLKDVAIELVFADTDTVPGTAILASVDVVNKGIIAFLGGARTTQQQVVSYMANAFKIPHIGGIVAGSIFSDKLSYPYFMRTSLADQVICSVMVKFILRMGWKNVVLITQDDAYGTGNRATFLQLATVNNLTVFQTEVKTGQTDFSTTVQIVSNSQIKIIVMLCSTNEATKLMATLKNQGSMVNEDYVYLIGQVYYLSWVGGSAVNATLFDGALAFDANVDTSTPAGIDLWDKWKNANQTLWPGSRGTLASTYWYLVEGLYTLALGLDNYTTANPNVNLSAAVNSANGLNGEKFYKTMRQLNYFGPSGQVEFDSNGDRLAYATIMNIRQQDKTLTTSATATAKSVIRYSPFDNSFTDLDSILFFGGRTSVPRDMACPCIHGQCLDISSVCTCDTDYGGSICDMYVGNLAVNKGNNSTVIKALVPSVVGAALIAAIAFFFYIRKRRAMLVKEISDKQRSEIPLGSIKLGKRIGRGASGEVYTATYRGTEVAVKKLSAKNLSQSALQQFQLETAIMAGLRHPNIILFMGSCYDKTNEEFLLVMEHMVRGSLFDVLYNHNISLLMELQLHLAYQIAQGINFLHQATPPIIHCDIKSHNVLLDEKWNCRICDFGITIFSAANKRRGDEALGTVYWTAPEVLSGESHTMASDCYSLGVLLWEIFHRVIPYSGRDPLVVALDVVNQGARPTLGAHLPPGLQQLIISCWDQEPSRRPSVQDVVHTLRDLALSKPVNNYTEETNIAPTGSVAFVATDILDAHKLWEAVPSAMPQVMRQLNSLIRSLLTSCKGYEVSFKNHSFLFAFGKTSDAINFSIAVQLAVLRNGWPALLDSYASTKQETNEKGDHIWSGPRVAMALHKGTPQCVQDRISQKMHYEGPVVKKVDGLLKKSVGGVVLMTKATFESIDKSKLELDLYEERNEKSDGDETTLFVVPKVLEVRLQNNPEISRVLLYDSETTSPYTVIDMTETPDSDVIPKTKEITEKGIITYDKLSLRDKIGVGSGAEVHSATYKGEEVAVKLLINQNNSEDNYFTLRYIASTLNTIKHPNILGFVGICLDPPHICMVSELMQTNLSKLYSGNASFPHSERIRIAKAVANGMRYLCQHEDGSLGNNLRLNSNNILLSKNGEVKISDFAVHKLYDSNRTLTSVNAVAWTPPEMLSSDEEFSHAVAVYSFGIILWEMLTRKKPYANIHPIRLLSMVAKGHRPEIPNDCPPAYASLMKSCWEGVPTDRPNWDTVINLLSVM